MSSLKKYYGKKKVFFFSFYIRDILNRMEYSCGQMKSNLRFLPPSFGEVWCQCACVHGSATSRIIRKLCRSLFRFGPSRVLLAGGLLNVIGSFLTPLAADMGVVWITVVRAVMGAGQVVNTMLSPLGLLLIEKLS